MATKTFSKNSSALSRREAQHKQIVFLVINESSIARNGIFGFTGERHSLYIPWQFLRDNRVFAAYFLSSDKASLISSCSFHLHAALAFNVTEKNEKSLQSTAFLLHYFSRRKIVNLIIEAGHG